MKTMLYKVESGSGLQQVTRALEAAAQKHKFGVIAVHDLKAKMKEKGVEFGQDYLIYEVCNPQQAKIVLERNPEISTALPCRISVYRDGPKIVLATIRPTSLIEMFSTPDLRAVAEEVESTIVKMMDEAAALPS